MPKVLLFNSIGTPYRPPPLGYLYLQTAMTLQQRKVKKKIKIKHLALHIVAYKISNAFLLLLNTYKETYVLTMIKMSVVSLQDLRSYCVAFAAAFAYYPLHSFSFTLCTALLLSVHSD